MYVIFNSELQSILRKNVKMLQFANDICIYLSDNSIRECTQKLDETYTNISNWMTFNGLEIAYEKTKTTIFTRWFIELSPYIILNDIEISTAPETNFLVLLLTPD